MIIIDEKAKDATLYIIKDDNSYEGNYSIVLQNTLTKAITIVQTLEDVGNEMYYIFENVDLKGLDDGEYYLLLFQNPDNLTFFSNNNKPSETTTSWYIYITNNGEYLVNNGKFLVIQGGAEINTLESVSSELLRIGDYVTPTTQYNNQKKFIQYGK